MSHVNDIKDLLRKTDKSFAEIAREVGVSARTVQNINSGRTHRESEESYPLRISGVQLSQLRERLKKPSTAAVPRAHVLSPQLLDYISFLSLIGANIDVLLTFKEVYYTSLVKHFGRELNDAEVLGIINLQPAKPTTLAAMIKAYRDPKLKLINTEYWLKTNFIKKSEKEALYSLLSR